MIVLKGGIVPETTGAVTATETEAGGVLATSSVGRSIFIGTTTGILVWLFTQIAGRSLGFIREGK